MENARVIRSAGMVGGLTLISRGLGFIRDVLLAGFFGTSMAMSAFVVAFRIPNLFRALFGEGALSAAFIPVFVETRHREGEESAWRLARQVFTVTALALAAIVAAGIGGASLALLRPNLTESARLTLSLLRILLPYMIFICLAAVAMGALNSIGHFAVPAAAPWILNLVEIAAIVWVCPRLGDTPEERIYGVVWAILLAGLLQWAVQLPALIRRGFRPRPLLRRGDARILRILALMGPVALGRAVTQVNVAIDTLLAAGVGKWAASALYFSERLIYLPLGIFATALSTVLLPLFSGHAARGDRDAVRDAVNHALRLLLFVMLPAAVGLWALSAPIVRMCFEWREFDARSTLLTARALRLYAPGLIVFSLGKVFVPAFYAMQDTRTPVRIGIRTVLLNIALSVLFMLTWPLEYKHAGIAFATVVSETVNGVWMAALLHRRLGSPGWLSIARSVGRSSVCAATMAAIAFLAQRGAAAGLLAAGWAEKRALTVSVVGAIALAAVAHLAAARLLRSPELREIAAAFRQRAGTARPAHRGFGVASK